MQRAREAQGAIQRIKKIATRNGRLEQEAGDYAMSCKLLRSPPIKGALKKKSPLKNVTAAQRARDCGKLPTPPQQHMCTETGKKAV